jgi:serine/threonine protein kinase
MPIQFPSFFKDDAAKDLIRKLLTYDPKERMTSFKEFKNHPWFENFHFVSLNLFEIYL